jgi:hypothetical protein
VEVLGGGNAEAAVNVVRAKEEKLASKGKMTICNKNKYPFDYSVQDMLFNLSQRTSAGIIFSFLKVFLEW